MKAKHLIGATSAANCFVVGASGAPAATTVANRRNEFMVQGADQFDNHKRVPVEAFGVAVTRPDGSVVTLARNTHIYYNQKGSHLVMWRSTLAGTHSLAVTFNGAPVRGSPFSVTVQPNVAYAPTSSLSGAGATASTAGTAASFSITSRDFWRNARTSGGAGFQWTFHGPLYGSLAPLTGVCPGSGGGGGGGRGCTDNGDGTYRVEYTPTLAGQYQVLVRLGSHYVSTNPTPLLMTVVPAELDVAATYLEAAAAMTAGDYTAFSVFPHDRFNNVLPESQVDTLGLSFTVTQITCVHCGAGSPGGVVSGGLAGGDCFQVSGSSQFNCSFSLQQTGVHRLRVLAGRFGALSATHDMEVSFGATAAATTVFLTSPTVVGTAGHWCPSPLSLSFSTPSTIPFPTVVCSYFD